MRYLKIVWCALLLALPVIPVLILAEAQRLSTWDICGEVSAMLVFVDLPIAICLLHRLRPQWFRLKKSHRISPFPWLALMLLSWIYVAGEMYLSIRLGHGPENGFSAFCAYCFGWAYIWFTMIPIGLLYLLIRAMTWAVTRLSSSFNRRSDKNA